MNIASATWLAACFTVTMTFVCLYSSADMGDWVLLVSSVVGQEEGEGLFFLRSFVCTETREHKMTFWGTTGLDHLYGQCSVKGYNF